MSPRQGRTVAVMQPTYLPWIGYLDLMDQCDVFVLLDCVQFEQRSWQQRNRVKIASGEAWLRVPVLTKGRRDQRVCEVELDRSSNFREKHLATIRHGYARAAHYANYAPQLAAVLARKHDRLVDLNADLIELMRGALGITTPLIRSSTIAADGHRVTRLISICSELGAKCYLSPLGSKPYIEENDAFRDHGIELRYHQYEHPVYPQLHGRFLSHLSAVDLLLNAGHESLAILQSGRRPSWLPARRPRRSQVRLRVSPYADV